MSGILVHSPDRHVTVRDLGSPTIVCAEIAGERWLPSEGARERADTQIESAEELLIGTACMQGGEVWQNERSGEILVWFESSFDAVRWALALSNVWARELAELPASQRPRLRLGIDCHVEGEPVEDCARRAEHLKGAARAGSIVISSEVFEEVQPFLRFTYRPVSFRPPGQGHLVQRYNIRPINAAPEPRVTPAQRPRRRVGRRLALAAAIVLLLGAGIGLSDAPSWIGARLLGDPSGEPSPPTSTAEAAASAGEGDTGPAADTAETAAGSDSAAAAQGQPAPEPVETAAATTEPPAAPEGPSEPDAAATSQAATRQVAERTPEPPASPPQQPPAAGPPSGGPPLLAVMPFGTEEGTAAPGYFRTGFTDLLVGRFTRFPHVSVLASETTRVFDGQVVQLNDLSRNLGVDYLLHGRAGTRNGELVVWARLLEVPSGRLVWSEPLQVTSSNPSDVVQRLGQAVLFGLEGRDLADLPAPGGLRPAAGTSSLQALDYALQWRSLFGDGGAGDNVRARAAAIRALELDPGFAAAYAYVAWTFLADFWSGSGPDPESARDEALRWARQGVQVDVGEYAAHWALGDVLQSLGRYEEAARSYEAALAINPNATELLQDFGTWLLPIMGRPDQGLELALRAMRLNPMHAESHHGNLALNYYLLERYDEAVAAVKRMDEPRLDHRLYLAASYGQLGAEADAAAEVEAILEARQGLTAEEFLASLPFQRDDDRQHLRSGLLRAGLPS